MTQPGPSRRTVLKALGLGSASLAVPGVLSGARATSATDEVGAGVRPVASRPNVVVMITDDQGYGDLSCHGSPVLRTPHLDRLHAESVRFTDFHVSPTCSPSRAALLTGRYPNRTGVWHTIMGRS